MYFQEQGKTSPLNPFFDGSSFHPFYLFDRMEGERSDHQYPGYRFRLFFEK